MQVLATRLTRLSLAFTLFLFTPVAHAKLLTGSGDAASWRAQGFQLSLQGDTDRALDSYQHAVNTALREYGADSSYVAALYYEMGTLALDAKKTHFAAAYLQKAVQQNPNSIMARVKYSEALQLTGKRDEARQEIQAALAKHPNSSEAREALVLWWQGKAKEDGLDELTKNIYNSRAIQESTNLGQALRRSAAQEPTQAVVAAVAPKPIASPAPAPKPIAPAPVKPAAVASAAAAPAKPLFGFPWMRPKPAEPKKEEKPPAKPPAKEVKKEPPKQEPKSKREKTKRAKPEKEPKPVPSTPAPPAEVRTGLVTTAKQLPKPKAESPAKKPEAAPKKPDTDEIQAPDQPPPKKEEPKKEEPKAVAQPAQPLRYVNPGIPINTKKPKGGSFVPPPPPMTPIFPGMPVYNPPPQAVQQAKAEAPKAKPKEKPKETPKEESKSSGGSEDPDFILEWAGKKKK